MHFHLQDMAEADQFLYDAPWEFTSQAAKFLHGTESQRHSVAETSSKQNELVLFYAIV